MGWFGSDDELNSQYKNVANSTLKELNEEFLAGFQYGGEEYSGAWEEKNWKDQLEKFAKALEKYDKISFIADAKNIGVSLGSIHGMLGSNLAYILFNDDKAAGILVEIIGKIKKMKAFNMKYIKKRVDKLNKKKLTESGLKNHEKIVKALLAKE